MTGRLVVLFLALFVGSVSVLVLMPKPTQGSLEMEIAKAALQLGVVAVAAGVVSLFVFEYQRHRQNEDKQRDLNRQAIEYREDLLKGILSRAMTDYAHAKTARRLMRSRALEVQSRGTMVRADEYDKCFDVINDAQLELENLARDVENSARAFSSAEGLVKQFRSMERYLSLVISEYEKSRRVMPGDGKMPLAALPELSRFIETTSKTGAFFIDFVTPYHNVQLAIREDLLHPKLPA